MQEVQVAVATRIENDVALMARITGAFDEAPTDHPLPYITYGTKVQIPYDVFQNRGWEVTLVLDIWTETADGDSHFLILNDIDRLFHGQLLTLETYINDKCIVEWATTLTDEAVSIRHTVARLLTRNQKAA